MVQSSNGIKLILHGQLKKLCPENHTFNVSTPREALKALFSQIKAFAPKPGGMPYAAKCVGFDKVEDLERTFSGEIHVVPAFAGGKNGGLIKIIIGVILIIVSFFFPPAWAGTASYVFAFGLSLALSGVVELMSPAPKLDMDKTIAGDPGASKYLGAPKNTVAIGTRIPLVYGRHIAYGHYLAFDIDAVDIGAGSTAEWSDVFTHNVFGAVPGAA